jgi:hypothetical protein
MGNKNDEARGLIGMFISHYLRFHLQGIYDLDEAWEKIESLFGKHNIIPSHQIENQIMTLSPNDFSCIEDYLSKFKTLRLLCAECNIKMEEECCIYIKFSLILVVHIQCFYLPFMSLEKL